PGLSTRANAAHGQRSIDRPAALCQSQPAFTTPAAPMTESRRPRPDLEKTLAELERIVNSLESGELPLEKSLKEFERGVRLSRECQTALRDAEKKVQILMGGQLQDFATGDGTADEEEPEDEDEEAGGEP